MTYNKMLALLPMLCFAGVSLADGVQVLEVQTIASGRLAMPLEAIDSISLSGDSIVFHSQWGEARLLRSDVVQMTPADTLGKEVTVRYDAQRVEVYNPFFLHGVSVTTDGAYVSVQSQVSDCEVGYRLSGQSTDGAFVMDGSYKITLTLDGLELASQRGAAIDIECGKRVAVVLPAGSNNTLSDAAGGSQKACMVFKGHPEWNGAGSLTLLSHAGHGIKTKEYMQLKKGFGSLTISGAQGDGIHAGQYFQMNGGTLTVSGIAGDGIQAEKTGNPADEQNGQLIIKGGTLNISTTADEVDCLQADSCVTITGGNITLAASGKGGRGMKVGTDLTVGSEGCADDALTLTASTTGAAAGTSTSTGDGPGGRPGGPGGRPGGGGPGDENLSGQPKAIKVMGNIVVNGGTIKASTKQNGGEGMESKATITINGGVVVCDTYDDGINAKTAVVINGGVVWAHATGNDGIDCNGSKGFTFNGGIILASGTRAPEEGFDCDNYSFAINGGYIIGTGGASSSVTKATQAFASASTSVTAGRYVSLTKSDGTVICSYLCPNTTSGTCIFSTPEFTSGTAYNVVYGVTAVNNPTASYLNGVFTMGGTLTGGTKKSITPKTK